MIPGEIFPAAGKIVLNSSIFERQKGCLWRKGDRIQSTGLNVLSAGEGVSSQKQMQFDDPDITKDPSAILGLRSSAS